jgi:very-short-patch-repair endonuclease
MAYLDGAYPQDGLAVEIDDFATHHGPRAMDDDHERQNELSEVLEGWRWVRVTPRQIRRRGQWVVDTVATALGLDPADHRLPPKQRRHRAG